MDPHCKIGLLRQSLKTVPDVGGQQRDPCAFSGGAKERIFLSGPQLFSLEHPCINIRLNTVRQDAEVIHHRKQSVVSQSPQVSELP